MSEYLIIGNSVAGTKAAEVLRSVDTKSKITIVSDEPYAGVYSKPLLVDYIIGKISIDNLYFRKKDFYSSYNIATLFGYKVKKIIPKKHKVIVRNIEIPYTKLLVATGASSKFPEIAGIRTGGVFCLRTLKDAIEIKNRLKIARNVVIVGGGLIGCKIASALSTFSHWKVTLVVSSSYLLSQMLDKESAKLIFNAAISSGVNIKLNTDVIEILGKKSVTAVKLSTEEIIPAEIVIIAKGVKPNVEFLSGMKINRGIIVDNKLQTSIENIYAAGDVVEAYDCIHNDFRINAMWINAVRQAEIAALNMAGKDVEYEGSININTGTFFGLTAFSFGVISGDDYQETVRKTDRFYEKILVNKAKKIVGYLQVLPAGKEHRLRTAGLIQNMAKLTFIDNSRIAFSISRSCHLHSL